MPYIGNQHNVGDHVNNFKVLDDISSHTATFDGSATSIVSAADDTIRIPEHRFIQGQRVTYTNGGGGNIGGLTSGTAYFISFDTANTIKLATTLANANSNTVINLTAVGSGTSHTLNVAFDGVNTKFKMTHGSGKAARLNNATQINVAINNVIQRPNINSVSFTEGFALEDNHKIVFKNAPTVNDIFWGSIIANTIENFDLRDNEVDNFTGDGSTTEFTLSTIPANNESVIVTIDGALQHPSDKNTTRAYTLIDSIIEFSAAPALNAEIQVRHIGFAGASTNDVSGFYGRTGNVALTSSDNITTGDITPRNINASGIITATTFDGAFSSSVGGSNANFTGIVTAGVFKGGDIEGRNLKITGLSTFTGAVNTQALTATSGTFSGNVSIGGTLTYEDVTNIDSVGIITARDGIDCNADLDVDGHTNLDNLSVAGVSTFNDNVILAEQKELRLEPSGAFKLYRGPGGGGANNFIKSTFGSINLEAANSFIVKVNNNEDSIAAYANDRVDLYHNNQIKLTTTGTGAIVTGILTATDLDIDGHTNLDNVSVAGVSTFAGNVVIADSIVHDGDPNTKIRFPTDDNISFEAGATGEVARFLPTSAGSGGPRMGLGTNNPTGMLHIYGSNPPFRIQNSNDSANLQMGMWDAANIMFQASNRTFKFATETTNDITFYTGGLSGSYERLRITSGGTVNIGGNYSHTGSKLQVTGNSTFTGNIDANGDIDVDGHTNLDNVSIAGVTTVSNKTQVNSIGIGIIPIDHHHIHIESANPRVLIRSTGTNASKILFGDNSSNDPGVIEYSHSENSMRFNTGNLERLRITGGGDLSLRTTTQNAYLGLTANSTAINTTLGSTAGTNPRMYLKGVGNGQSDAGDVFIGAGTGGIVHIRSAELMKFEVNSDSSLIEGLRIDSSGRVMIGTTTSDQTFRVYNGNGDTGYKTALFDSNSTHGTRLVITNSNNTSNRGLGIIVGGQYAGTDRASFGWFNSDNTYVSPNLMTIQADGKIGIGRNDPVNFVDIARGSDEENILIVRGADNTTEYGAMGIYSGNCVITGGGAGSTNTGIMFRTAASGNETNRLLITSSGHVEPATDDTYNFGSLTKRWANIYTADLNLSNEGSKNDVDGTWGQYTIQEGEDNLYLINKRNGKKYMFVLKEVS